MGSCTNISFIHGFVDSIGSSTELGDSVGMSGGATLSGAGGPGCGTTPSCAGFTVSGDTVSSCYFSSSGVSGINSYVLGGALVTGGRSYLLGVSDPLSGTAIALTYKQLSIGLASGISGGGGGSYGSSSQIIGLFAFFVEKSSIQLALFGHNPYRTERV